MEFIEKKILRDNNAQLFEREIKKNLRNKADIVITSGAVSAGKFDFIPDVIKKFKLKIMFKGVSIRPGKPIMYAKFNKHTSFFGLPGIQSHQQHVLDFLYNHIYFFH